MNVSFSTSKHVAFVNLFQRKDNQSLKHKEVSHLSTRFNFPVTTGEWEIKSRVNYLLVGRSTGSVSLTSKADLFKDIPKT